MKLNGKTLDNGDALFGPVLVRRGEELFAFIAQPVWTLDDFHALVPVPEPPVTGYAPKKADGSGGKKQNKKDPKYLEDLENYGRKQWGYLVLTSLAPSNLDLSDHGVDHEDPETWVRVEDALRYDEKTNPQGLSHFEFKQVMDLVDEANMLDAAKVEENLETFFAERARQDEPEPTSQDGEAESSRSGEHVNAGA